MSHIQTENGINSLTYKFFDIVNDELNKFDQISIGKQLILENLYSEYQNEQGSSQFNMIKNNYFQQQHLSSTNKDITDFESFELTKGNKKFTFTLVQVDQSQSQNPKIMYTNKQNYQNIEAMLSELKFYCVQYYEVGRFLDCKILGKGSQATVYKVYDNQQISHYRSQQRTKYALKKINKIDERPTFKNQIQNEVKIQRRLTKYKTNCVKIHSVFEDEQHLYLLLDYQKGGSLKDLIKKRRCLNENQARVIIQQLLQTLNKIHRLGIYHRDLTPQNVLFNKDVKDSTFCTSDINIADFGLSAFYTKQTKNLSKCGTPGYIAPEVLIKGEYSNKADIFGIGCILYYMIKGMHLFSGSDANNTLKQNAHCQVQNEINSLNGFSQKMKDFLKSTLSQNPQKRPTTADAVTHQWLTPNAKIFGDTISSKNYQISPNREPCLSNKIEGRSHSIKFSQVSYCGHNQINNERIQLSNISCQQQLIVEDLSYSNVSNIDSSNMQVGHEGKNRAKSFKIFNKLSSKITKGCQSSKNNVVESCNLRRFRENLGFNTNGNQTSKNLNNYPNYGVITPGGSTLNNIISMKLKANLGLQHQDGSKFKQLEQASIPNEQRKALITKEYNKKLLKQQSYESINHKVEGIFQELSSSDEGRLDMQKYVLNQQNQENMANNNIQQRKRIFLK
eukprot:403372544